jgi:hypothetical protein
MCSCVPTDFPVPEHFGQVGACFPIEPYYAGEDILFTLRLERFPRDPRVG